MWITLRGHPNPVYYSPAIDAPFSLTCTDFALSHPLSGCRTGRVSIDYRDILNYPRPGRTRTMLNIDGLSWYALVWLLGTVDLGQSGSREMECNVLKSHKSGDVIQVARILTQRSRFAESPKVFQSQIFKGQKPGTVKLIESLMQPYKQNARKRHRAARSTVSRKHKSRKGSGVNTS